MRHMSGQQEDQSMRIRVVEGVASLHYDYRSLVVQILDFRDRD